MSILFTIFCNKHKPFKISVKVLIKKENPYPRKDTDR
jgi:hypothetical protein